MALPPDVRRIAGWLRRQLPMLEQPDAESLAWEAVWVHGACPLAVTAAKRDAIDLLRRDRGRNLDRLPPAPVGLHIHEEHHEPGFADVDTADQVARILCQLPPREAFVLTEVDLRERTHASVGADIGLTGSMVCRIRSAALTHARALATA